MIHGNKYDYSKTIFTKSSEKVCIICPIHGEFWQAPFNHLQGNGCRKCDNERKKVKMALSTDEFIEKAKTIHGDKYDYSKVDYKGCYEKVCIVCPTHGEFWQKASYHLNGNGCPNCGLIKIWDKRGRITTEEFIEKAKKIHGEKYDYSKVEYINERTKVCIICPKHGEFWQTPDSHIHGNGCPHCRNSFLERKVFNFLNENKIKFEKEKTYKWLVNNGHMYLDFYLPEYNLAIECQGIQHYANIKIRGEKKYNYIHDNDIIKNRLCEENGIKIIYFTDKNMYENYCKNKELTYYDLNSMINYIKKNEF